MLKFKVLWKYNDDQMFFLELITSDFEVDNGIPQHKLLKNKGLQVVLL